MEMAAKQAGFGGYIGTITESTAAATVYGSFASVPIENNENTRMN